MRVTVTFVPSGGSIGEASAKLPQSRAQTRRSPDETVPSSMSLAATPAGTTAGCTEAIALELAQQTQDWPELHEAVTPAGRVLK